MTTHFRIRKAFVAMLLAYFALPFFVLAANDYVALTTIPGATEGCAPVGYNEGVPVYNLSKCKTSDPVKVITNIYGVSIGIAAILAVGMIIWAGIEYATVESIQGHSDAKDRWQGAIFGLLLLLSSYLILRTINIDLVNINLDLGTPKSACKDSNGNDILDNGKSTCVGSEAISELLTGANNAAATYQKALQNAQAAQEKLAIAEKQLATAQASGNASQIAAAESVFAATKIESQNAVVTSKVEALNASSGQGKLQVDTLVKKGDFEAANKKVEDVSNKLQEDVSDLQLSKADPAVVEKARASKLATVGILKQEVYIDQSVVGIEQSKNSNITVQNARSSNAYSQTNDTAYNFAADERTQQKIIEARQGLASQYNSNAVQIRNLDTTEASSYNKSTNAQLRDFDAKVAKTVGCKNGINVTSTSVTCKN